MTDDLIERALRGEASEAELAELVAWRRATPANEQHYRRTERLIKAARALRPETAVPRPSAASIIAASTAGAGASHQPARPAAWANDSSRRVEAETAAAVWPGSRTAVHPRRVPRRSRIARAAPWGIAAAAVLVAALNLRDAAGPAPAAPAEVITSASELATVKLGDGTVVRLAPSSRLQFNAAAARNGGAAREVTLDGRAFFVVAKQRAGQPFRVRTRAATVNVLGTRFELATDAGDESAVQLHVVEGRVALEAPRNRVEVAAGERSGVREGMAAAPVRTADTAAVPAWLGRFLVFQATPLQQAAREIERLYDVRVVIADPELAAATVTATFADRPIDNVVNVMCEVLSAPCIVQDGVATIGR